MSNPMYGRGRRGCDRMVVRLTTPYAISAYQLPMQSVSITTNVVSSNPTQEGCIRYNIM
jgi:hypothetical protein